MCKLKNLSTTQILCEINSRISEVWKTAILTLFRSSQSWFWANFAFFKGWFFTKFKNPEPSISQKQHFLFSGVPKLISRKICMTEKSWISQCGNYGNFLSSIFGKNLVKVTVLLRSWFDEKNWWEGISRFSTQTFDSFFVNSHNVDRSGIFIVTQSL